MKQKIAANKLSNANVYINGTNLLGRAKEVELPSLESAMTEHEALGMVAKIEFPNGVEPMEMSITWNAPYEEVFAEVFNPYNTLPMQVRGNLEKYGPLGREAEVPVVWDLLVMPKMNELGSLVQNEKNEPVTEFAVHYIKSTVNGVENFEIDPLANILKINGVDQLETYKENLGA